MNATTEFPGTREGLAQFLEGVMLNSLDENPFAPLGKVTLITVHNTKGLEFDRVFLTGLEEGIFPHFASTAGGTTVSGDELEEERRLFYVGATRAREQLLLTCCRRRRVFGSFQAAEPSRFLSEVPAELLAVRGREPSARGRTLPAGLPGLPRGLRSRGGHPGLVGRGPAHDRGALRLRAHRPLPGEVQRPGKGIP